MTINMKMALTALALVAVLGACGRKGDLEPPPGMSPAAIAAQDKAEADAKKHNCVTLNEDGTTYSAPAPIDANSAGGAESGNPNLMKTEETDESACK
ncbi:MAG: LPS translocon maturation chaperone LptM [Parvibaculaceae bacterium]